MIFADALSFLRYSKAPSIIALIQLSLTFAVLGNVLAMVDAYREQIVSVSGYFDEDGLLAVSLYKNGNEVPSSRWRDEIARDLEAIEAVPGVVEIALAHEGVPMQRNFTKPRSVGLILSRERVRVFCSPRLSQDLCSVPLTLLLEKS